MLSIDYHLGGKYFLVWQPYLFSDSRGNFHGEPTSTERNTSELRHESVVVVVRSASPRSIETERIGPVTAREGKNMAKRTKSDDPESMTTMGNDSTASTVSGVVDSAKQAASQAKDAASQVLDQAKDKATSRADEQRLSAATGFTAVAQAFKGMGEDLRNKDQGPVAGYAAEIGQAMGGQVERLANYLRERDVRGLVDDTEKFARSSPAVFLGSAFVLGLLASRFLKSSRPAPDFIKNMPDPQKALPPASTPPMLTGAGQQTSSAPSTAPPFWATPSNSPSEGIRPSKPATGLVGSDPAGK